MSPPLILQVGIGSEEAPMKSKMLLFTLILAGEESQLGRERFAVAGDIFPLSLPPDRKLAWPNSTAVSAWQAGW